MMTSKVKELIGFHYLLTAIGIEYIPQEVLSQIKENPITYNIKKIPAHTTYLEQHI